MPSLLSSFSDEAGGTIDEQIDATKRAGLHFVDLRNGDGFNITALPLHHAGTVAQKLRDAGLKVHMFGSPLGKIDIAEDFAIDARKMEHLAALAPILDCRAVRIFSYYNKDKAPHDQWRRESFRRLRKLTRIAEKSGMILYHENESHIFGDHCSEVLELAELRDATFKMIFDFGNFNAGRENAWDNWLQLAAVTDAIHLKDNAWGADGQLQHVPVGQGGGHVQRILADAAARNWTGPFTIEPHLTHSAAVAATGPSGIPNQSYANMPPGESFHIACLAAQAVLDRAGFGI